MMAVKDEPRRAVVIAPNHSDTDLRVRRTAEVLQESGFEVRVHWDRDYPGHAFPGRDETDLMEIHSSRPRWALLRSLLGRRGLTSEVADAIRSVDLFYVHAGGIEGLVYAREAARTNPACRIIFDYHDYLPFELHYQLKKRHLGALFPFAWAVHRQLARYLAAHIHAVVGISPGQIEHFQDIAARPIPGAVVPNVRPFDPDLRSSDPVAPGIEDGQLAFVWLGQVMLGRDLERVADWVAGVESGHLHVLGTILDHRAVEAIRRVLGERVTFHGTYAGDIGVSAAIPARAVGVFLGWDDPRDTGINAIASPNKYYTYVNLGLPVIVDARLEGQAAELDEWGAGVAVGDRDGFAGAVARIRACYGEYAAGMGRMKLDYYERDPKQPLRELIERVFR